MSWLSSQLFGVHPSKQAQEIIRTANAVGKIVVSAVESAIPGASAVIGAVETLASGASTTAQKVAAGTTVVTAIDPSAIAQAESAIYDLITDLGVEIGESTFDALMTNTLANAGIAVGAPAATVTAPAAGSAPSAAPAPSSAAATAVAANASVDILDVAPVIPGVPS